MKFVNEHETEYLSTMQLIPLQHQGVAVPKLCSQNLLLLLISTILYLKPVHAMAFVIFLA